VAHIPGIFKLARLRVPSALLYVFVAMVLPHRADWINAQSFVFIPLELWVTGLLLLAPVRGPWLRIALGLMLAAGIILRLADLAVFEAFARSFNPAFDFWLLIEGMDLLNGATGRIGAVLIAALLIVLILGIVWASLRALAILQQWLQTLRPPRAALWLIVALALSILWRMAGLPRTTTYFSDQLREHAQSTIAGLHDLRSFRAELAQGSPHELPDAPLFSALEGKDVLVVFVESYGRIALEGDLFAPTLTGMLQQHERELDDAGLGMRSAWLTSPTIGGLSWLAQATALSGLWIDSQLRYDSLVRSDRATLNRLFQRAGWRTVGVMPAITMPWPEGDYFGFDQFYAANDLGYRGAPFNWITMPDQYVLAAFQRMERNTPSHPPVMAEIALISSHAPWTPIPRMIDWQDVGDGSVFTEQATAGPTPEQVWSSEARIRDHYRQSVAYALDNLLSWVQTYGDENLVVLALGDHQPSPLVSGDAGNRDVPVHLIARDPTVLDAMAHWQWSQGLQPAADAPRWRMDALRDRFVEAFSRQR
jgi:hypothetical protein